MIALYIVIAGACCLVAGFLIGFFIKRPAGDRGGSWLQIDIEGLKSDLKKKEEAFSSLKEEKVRADLDNATLSEKCRGYEERIKGLEDAIKSKESDFASRLEKQQAEMQRREEALRSSIEKEFEKNRTLQKEAEERKNEDSKNRAQTQTDILKALSPLAGQLSSLQEKLSSIEENRSEEVGELKGSIESLKNMEQAIQDENRNFSNLLNNNQLRGRWGEIQLENLVKKCGMNKYVDFNTQLPLCSKEEGDKKEGRPDLVIFLPGNGAMPVDAKTSIEKFKEAEEEEKTDPGREYAKVVRGHVNELSKRNYPKLLLENGFEPLDFTVAYIPVASWLQGAIAADKDLLDYAFSKNVVLCSSASFWALLQAISVSWKNWSLEEDALEIKKLGEDLYDSLGSFSKHLDKLRSGLKTALEGYNSLVGNVDSRLIPRARRLREAKLVQKDLQEPAKIDMEIKALKSMEKEGKEK